MRISTMQLQSQSIGTLQRQQIKLSEIQEQLATGKRLQTAADDPTDYAAALDIRDTLKEVRQFQGNAQRVAARLAEAESTLGEAADTMARIRELALAANNATLDDASRKIISVELGEMQKRMLELANSRGPDGRYLFAGTADGTQPFTQDGKTINYVGDQRSRSVGVGPGQQLAAVDAGSEIFMRIRGGDGAIRAEAAVGNTGTAVLQSLQMTDAKLLSQGPYELRFIGNEVEVRDSSGTLVSSQPYEEGAKIDLPGASVQLQGAPADGDSFKLESAPTRSVFETVQGLIDVLGTPQGGSGAGLSNALFTGLADLASASDHLIDSRAAIGGRMARLESIENSHEASLVQLQETLSQLEDTDMVDAVSRLQSQLAGLEVAQQAFVRVQNLSLFRFLG